MQPDPIPSLIGERYGKVHHAIPGRCFDDFMSRTNRLGGGAALGFRRAGAQPLFLEQYLDEAIEVAVSRAMGGCVARENIIEIGNLASDNGRSMIALWGQAANDFGSHCEYAVATLTAPVRAMFARIGLPITQLAQAAPAALGEAADAWGRYYDLDPCVCAGQIAAGQRALAAYAARIHRSAAA